MINQEDNCRIRIVYLVLLTLFSHSTEQFWYSKQLEWIIQSNSYLLVIQPLSRVDKETILRWLVLMCDLGNNILTKMTCTGVPFLNFWTFLTPFLVFTVMKQFSVSLSSFVPANELAKSTLLMIDRLPPIFGSCVFSSELTKEALQQQQQAVYRNM